MRACACVHVCVSACVRVHVCMSLTTSARSACLTLSEEPTPSFVLMDVQQTRVVIYVYELVGEEVGLGLGLGLGLTGGHLRVRAGGRGGK